MSYKHLSQTERYQIYALMKAGHLPVEIAKLLGRHKSSISRELSRNKGKRGYRPQQADQRYQERAQSSRNARRVGEAIRALVAQRLELHCQHYAEPHYRFKERHVTIIVVILR